MLPTAFPSSAVQVSWCHSRFLTHGNWIFQLPRRTHSSCHPAALVVWLRTGPIWAVWSFASLLRIMMTTGSTFPAHSFAPLDSYRLYLYIAHVRCSVPECARVWRWARPTPLVDAVGPSVPLLAPPLRMICWVCLCAQCVELGPADLSGAVGPSALLSYRHLTLRFLLLFDSTCSTDGF